MSDPQEYLLFVLSAQPRSQRMLFRFASAVYLIHCRSSGAE